MKLLQRKRKAEEHADVTEERPACQHIVLVAPWDRAEDVGREDVVASYQCESCGAEFTRFEAERLRLTESARLQRHVGG